jgi:hypothetical protein
LAVRVEISLFGHTKRTLKQIVFHLNHTVHVLSDFDNVLTRLLEFWWCE